MSQTCRVKKGLLLHARDGLHEPDLKSKKGGAIHTVGKKSIGKKVYKRIKTSIILYG